MMRNLLLLCVTALCSVSAYSIPANPCPVTYRQPDGTTVEVLILGDERNHIYLTTDGYLLSVDGARLKFTGTDIAACNPSERPVGLTLPQPISDTDQLSQLLDNKISQKGSGATAARSIGLRPEKSFPATGTPRALVVLVDYQDTKFSVEDPHDYFSRMLTEEGFADLEATGSALDFFKSNSSGAFQPQFDVYGPITLSQPMAYYGGDNAMRRDAHAWKMAVEACQQLDDTVDFSIYDNDGDGLIDNIFIFYAGEGQSTGGSAETVWPHSWTIDEQTSDTFTFDGVKLNRYGCSNEWEYGRPDGVGTFIHEFSHVLGLPDLYTTNGSKAFTPGAWSTLDAGPYNNNGMTPPHYGAYERYSLGWIEPQVISEATTVTLNPISTNEACIIPTADPNEFFLLENRQLEGWDGYVPGHGLLIWHIHYDPAVWDAEAVNNTVNHQYVDIEEADGIKSESTRAGDAFPGTYGITEFSDDTYPSMLPWSGVSLNLPITDIAENPDGSVTFKVAGGGAGIDLQKADDHEAPARYFGIDGRQTDASRPGLYIRHRGTDVEKIIIR